MQGIKRKNRRDTEKQDSHHMTHQICDSSSWSSLFPANVSEGGLPSAATEQSGWPSRRTTGLFDSRGPVCRTGSFPGALPSLDRAGREQLRAKRVSTLSKNCPSSRLFSRRESRRGELVCLVDWSSRNRKGEPGGWAIAGLLAAHIESGRESSNIWSLAGRETFPAPTRV